MMHFRLFAILLLLVAGSTTVVSGQTQQEPALDMEFTDIPLSEAISRIEKNTRYTFFYDAKQTDLSQRVSLKAKRMPISAALKEMLAPTGLNFTITERQIALIPARKAAARQRTIAGVVNDSSETPLAGVAVTLVGDNTRGAVTEANGSFTLTVPDADITLSFTYLGYVSKKVAVPATQNNLTHCFLATGVEQLGAQRPDPTEDIRVHLFSRDEVLELLRTDRIRQALMAAPLWRWFAEKGILG